MYWYYVCIIIASKILLISKRRYIKKCGYKVITKCSSVWYAVDVAAIGAKVGIRYVIKDDESDEEDSQNDREGGEDQAKFLSSVPLADDDVGNKDEGRENSKNETAYLGEVVNVW